MEITLEDIKGKTVEDIVRQLVEHVTKSEDEIENKKSRGGKTTDLKIFVADNRNLEPGNLAGAIEDYVLNYDLGKYSKRFFNDHVVTEDLASENISFVQIATPGYDRTDDFIFIFEDGYLWVLTTERREWTENTVEKLIKYLPQVERLYLSSDDLENVTYNLSKSRVSGFTARFHTQHRERNATLVFHGAEDGDLEKAEEVFGATPSRIAFDQANSPQTAIQGSHANDAIVTVESVRQGSQEKAVETTLNILGQYQKYDFANYEVENEPNRLKTDSGILIDGFTSIELVEPEREYTEDLAQELRDNVLTANQYDYGNWGENTFFVYDKIHEEVFEVGVEGTNIVVHARETTTALSLRSFCQRILDKFDSTYSIRKKTVEVSG